ncbi:MAG: DUF4118 domain-containing protein [Thermomicrobiales bacterium]|nr:DUF4118 domain-containing protein [Thermomicrobiales bacterium]
MGQHVGTWWRRLAAAEPPPWRDRRYGFATTVIALATAAMAALHSSLGLLNVLLLYLLLSFTVALATGPGPAAWTAVLGFLAFDFFFIPHYQSLSVARSEYAAILFAYLGVAIVTGQLVARVRTRTEAAERERRRTALLYELNRALVGGVTLDAILDRIVERVVHVYGAAGARILLPDGDVLAVRAVHPASAGAAIDAADLAIAEQVRRGNPAAALTHGSHRRDEPDTLFIPIASPGQIAGVLQVWGRPRSERFRPDDETLLISFAGQAALALERARLTDEAAHAAALARSDELKSALLSAVSHDLRTPLASIKASVTALMDDSVTWGADVQREFLEAIDEETDRLTLVVGNLLDLSRIEGGALRPEREWYDVAELVEDVLMRMTNRASDHRLTATVEPGLPLLRFDYVEISQVLVNLVENALKYTPPGTSIAILARLVPGAVELGVHDAGPGIAAHHQHRLFEKFYRSGAPDGIGGSGIGLAICKGLVEAHGGEILVRSAPGAGTSVLFTLPLDTPDAPVAADAGAAATAR